VSVCVCVRVRVCVCVCVHSPLQQHEEDVLLGAEVLHGGRPRTDLAPQDVVEDLRHVLLALVAKHTAAAESGLAHTRVCRAAMALAVIAWWGEVIMVVGC